MAGNVKNTWWESNLTLHDRDDDTASWKSSTSGDDNLKQTPVGSFMCELFEKQLYTDVEFVSKHTKDSFSAHRVVLAAKCSYFESELFGKQKNDAPQMKMQVEIKHKPFSVFKDIVEYLYTDRINFSDISYVLNVRPIAVDLEIEALSDRCEEYLDSLELNEDNVCTTLQVASEKSAEELRERCIEYIKKNTAQVISSPDFEKCSFTTAREICDLQDLSLNSESQVLEASLRWINVQPDHTRNDLKKAMMKCIRFLSFSRQEFGDLLRRYQDMLSSGDALAILVYLNDPKSKNVNELPNWINKTRRKFQRGIQAAQRGAKGIVKIPLKPASEQQPGLNRLTSIIQMHCIKGSHKIDAVKFSLAEAPPAGSKASIVIRAFVSPSRRRRQVELCRFYKSINSKETTVVLATRMLVSCGQTVHLKVEFSSGAPCRFLQFDDEALDEFDNEHFECSLISRPAKERFFVIDEIEYGDRPLPKFLGKNVQSARGACPQEKK